MIRKPALIVLGTLLVTLAVLDLYGLRLLRQHGLLLRFVPAERWEEVRQTDDPSALAVLGPAFEGGDPKALLAQVMNLVGTIGRQPPGGALAVYEHVRAGGGAVCSGMALLYTNALRAKGIEARQVGLRRSLFDVYDTHTTVEVLVDGRWVIFDPTFHVSFEKDGMLLGAAEILAARLDGSYVKVRPVFYGEVRYPARLETYYVNWLALFDNVFIDDLPHRGLLARLPPFRYWFGPVAYVKRVPGHRDVQYEFQDRLLFAVLVVLPASMLGLGSVAGLLLLRPHLGRVLPRRRPVPARAASESGD